MAGKKPDARVRYTKMVIRDSFIALLSAKPLSRITVTEICGGAGVNRATFYSHYSGPRELLTSIEAEVMNDIVTGLQGSFSSADPDLKDVLTRVFEYIRENAGLCRLLLSDSGDESFQAQVVALLKERFLSEWSGFVSPEDAEYLYTFAAIGSVGLVRKWLADDMKKSPAEMAEFVMELANNGYSAFR